MDVDEGSVKSYKLVRESLVLNAFTSSESLKRGDVRDVDEGSGQSLGTVHETLVHVTYLSSEGLGERAHSYIIGYQKQQEDKNSRRQLRGW